MDTSLEGFFRKREMSLSNFNLLLLALNAKKDISSTEETLEKMEALGIKPDERSFSLVISTFAKHQDLEKTEKYFLKATTAFGKSAAFYSGLMMAYSRARRPDDCLKIMDELKDAGIKPDLALITTLVQSLKYADRFDQCFKYYDEVKNKGQKLDEVFLTLMMKVCAKTHEAEKAVRIFNDNKPEIGFYRTSFPYNAYIRALASRDDYARQAEGVFTQMLNYQVKPDQDSIIALLQATTRTGNVKQAFNALQVAKENNIPMSTHVFTGLIRTYAGASRSKETLPELVKEYKKDAWALFKQADENRMVNHHTLDALIDLHSASLDMEGVEGLVLPQYEQRGLQMGYSTYEILLKGYTDTQEIPKIVRIYEKIRNEPALLTANSLNIVLHNFIRLIDPVKIEEVLNQFLERKLQPKGHLLHSLGNSVNLPENLYVLLHKFDKKYGVISSKKYKIATEIRQPSFADEIGPVLATNRRKLEKRRPGLWDSLFKINK